MRAGGGYSLQQIAQEFGEKDSRSKDPGFEIDFLCAGSSRVAKRRGAISRSPLPSLKLSERS